MVHMTNFNSHHNIMCVCEAHSISRSLNIVVIIFAILKSVEVCRNCQGEVIMVNFSFVVVKWIAKSDFSPNLLVIQINVYCMFVERARLVLNELGGPAYQRQLPGKTLSRANTTQGNGEKITNIFCANIMAAETSKQHV